MSPQFVDFDADGHLDIVTGTFDGSPHWARGGPQGFHAPEHVLDSEGDRILLEQFWDYDAREWRNTGKAHGISAVAFDWDADGDQDLLLGDYHGVGGKIFRCMNEGSASEPRFSTTLQEVMAGGRSFGFDGGLTAPRLVDWDADGVLDLVCGSFGESWGSGGGGVWWFRNAGDPGAPRFEAGRILIAPEPPGGSGPRRPDAGLYVDPVDYDGDGDLDLLVGGYSLWTGEPVPGARAARESGQQRDSFVWLYRRRDAGEQASAGGD